MTDSLLDAIRGLTVADFLAAAGSRPRTSGDACVDPFWTTRMRHRKRVMDGAVAVDASAGADGGAGRGGGASSMRIDDVSDAVADLRLRALEAHKNGRRIFFKPMLDALARRDYARANEAFLVDTWLSLAAGTTRSLGQNGAHMVVQPFLVDAIEKSGDLDAVRWALARGFFPSVMGQDEDPSKDPTSILHRLVNRLIADAPADKWDQASIAFQIFRHDDTFAEQEAGPNFMPYVTDATLHAQEEKDNFQLTYYVHMWRRWPESFKTLMDREVLARRGFDE